MKAKILSALLALALLLAAGMWLYFIFTPLPPVPPAAPAPAPVQARDERPLASSQPVTERTFAELANAARPPSAPISREPVEEPPAAATPLARVFQRPVRPPLIFQDFDEQASGLNEVQIQMLRSLREDFAQDVGGLEQDPRDPAYAERWRQMQARYDEKLSAILGSELAEQLARLAAQTAADAAGRH